MNQMIFRRRSFAKDERGLVGILLIGVIAIMIVGGLFFVWVMSMIPQIGIGVLYIAIAIAIVIGVANISKSMLNKSLPKAKGRA